MTGAQSTWRVEHRTGTAQELHDAAASDPVDGRAVVVQHVVEPSLVLGSTQDAADVDAAALELAGLASARRRSGGGAVVLRPDDHVWVDLVVPADDPLHDDDVERAAWWVGDSWSRALGRRIDDRATEVHRRGVSDRAAGRVACFAALGPGEVSLDGRKVLGVSQRRTRSGARFQCVAYRFWEPELLLDVLVPTGRAAGLGGGEWGDGEPAAVLRRALVERAGAALPTGWDVVEHLVPHLP